MLQGTLDRASPADAKARISGSAPPQPDHHQKTALKQSLSAVFVYQQHIRIALLT